MKKIVSLLLTGIVLASCGGKSSLNEVAKVSHTLIENIKIGSSLSSFDPKDVGGHAFKNDASDKFGLSMNPIYELDQTGDYDLKYQLKTNGKDEIISIRILASYDKGGSSDTPADDFVHAFSNLIEKDGFVYDADESVKVMMETATQTPSYIPYLYNNEENKTYIDAYINTDDKKIEISYFK